MNEIDALRERAKELRCLYLVDEIVSQRALSPERVFLRVLEAVPLGWQRPETTGARIVYLGRSHVGPGYSARARTMSEAIRLRGVEVGRIEVSDSSADTTVDSDHRFLAEEVELLGNVASRLGEYLEWKHSELFGDRAGAVGNHWKWREGYAEALATRLSRDTFGPCRVFLGGSTERGDAGPGSDIDLFVLSEGSAEEREALAFWLDGWSSCLAEVSFQQTGHPFPRGILNVHWLAVAPDARHRPDLRELTVSHREAIG